MGKTFISILSFVLALWAGSLSAAPEGVGYQATPCIKAHVSAPEDFKVFIDKSTNFAFVCTPAGWRFVGKAGSKAR